MSVTIFVDREWGNIGVAALAGQLGEIHISPESRAGLIQEMAETLAVLAEANANAWQDRYGERVTPVSAVEIAADMRGRALGPALRFHLPEALGNAGLLKDNCTPVSGAEFTALVRVQAGLLRTSKGQVMQGARA